MCGIAGIVHFDGSSADPAVLDAMTDSLAHRGPDGRGTFIRGGCGLGHRRLSIIDLSSAAAQPMLSQDKDIVLTFNGEIYNFHELREELKRKKHVFHSNGDTEVLLRLYEEEGPACVRKLAGMFAFAVLDRRRNILFLARDRAGKKPLKYFYTESTFAFASEQRALRRVPGCPREIDFEAVHHALTMMYLPSPLTGIEGIHKLPAAHTLTVDLKTGARRPERYWQLERRIDESLREEEWIERLHAQFNRSVARRMVADVPVGAFLSGGIDSAAVVATMSTLRDRPVRTFSIGSGSTRFNELPDAQMIAKLFWTEHHPIVLEPDIVHLLPQLVRGYDEPYGDPSSIPMYLLAQKTRESVTVALNGDGGDENFAGYVRYPIFAFSQRCSRRPSLLRHTALLSAEMLHHLRKSTFSYRAVRFASTIDLQPRERYLQYLSFFTEDEKRRLYRAETAGSYPSTASWYAQKTSAAYDRGHDDVSRAMSMDLDTYLPDDLLPKVDIATMAHGLEARSPFLDHEMLELSAQIPTRFLLQGRKRKLILKKMLQGVLPDDYLARPKRGFRLPLDEWFRGPLRPFVRERLLTGDGLFFSVFDRTALETFIRHYERTHIDYSDHLWMLLWVREWMDVQSGASSA